ncbi:Alpha-L-fucosidase [Pseudarcicella hirudinis]|uniref:alpha-L-fucosidase n=1 Tax=Pseudarcicella hirudinis TaxID=1079859 RepID=A0A1I5VHP2_9BACT|nr:alpha-L-fucosidase [Pseudarcicella hirudinis]SFQ06892.1 Alpha-L-fucosidase [Pseudarcicella hirudinis]
MKKILLLCCIAFSCYQVNAQKLKPYGAIPNNDQLNWHKMEYYGFVHFNMNTFTEKEWGDGIESPDSFNPTQLDCRQWARIAKAAGMKGLILTAKHHDGFCLYPSRYTKHSVAYSKWRNGKGDVVKELAKACKEYGIKFGIYLSPWDRNHPKYGTDEYNQVYMNTQKELLTQYGDIFEFWFDGANGEGPSGKKQVYDWKGFIGTVRKYQPHAIMFSDNGPDVRWVGNESGHAYPTNWSTLNKDKYYPGYPKSDEFKAGNEDGINWVPAEVDVSIRPGWYYHANEDGKVKTADSLMNIYYASVGQNGNLLLNIPVDRRGLVHENDSTSLMQFKKLRDKAFALNQAKLKKATASSARKEYPVLNINDGNRDTDWAAKEGVNQANIDLNLGKEKSFNTIVLLEGIRYGQRIKEFNVEAWDGTKFVEIAKGTTIGNKRILRFPTQKSSKIRVNITDSKASPVISEIGVY